MHTTSENQYRAIPRHGTLKIYPEGRPDTPYLVKSNIIVNVVSALTARLFANLVTGTAVPTALGSSGDCTYGVWGMAFGTGSGTWGTDNQPAATATQTALVTEVLRKPLSGVQYVDSSGTPLSAGSFSTDVVFQCTLNPTVDTAVQGVALRELGLIGGGTNAATYGGPTNMLTAPYWDPTSPSANSVVLVDYLTLPSFYLADGLSTIFALTIEF